MAEFEFTLARQEQEITIKMESGEVQKFKVVEMSGTDRDQWLNSMGSRMKVDSKGNAAGLKDFTGLQSGLVARCLRDSTGQPIAQVLIDKWPASVVTGLFKLCQKINGMGDEKDEEEVKND